jgi:hypothetical protein
MKKIINYIRDFLKEDFHWGRYISSIILLILAFYLRYSENFKYIADFKLNYLIQFTVFFFIFYLVSFQKINLKLFLFLIFSIFVLQLNLITKDFAKDLINLFNIDRSYYDWLRKVFTNFQKPIALLVPLIIPYLIQRKKLNSFYGLTKKGFDAKIYLIMLLVMIPLIVIAAESDAFQRMYPRYKPGIAEAKSLIKPYISVGIFELTYWQRFLGVEIFFRGFLAIGGVLLLGRKAILPAACVYSVWHFGKPMGEAIGAFFGGYILGIIAVRTKSIFGGIAIHYGVALIMELAAWFWILQK